MLNYYGEGAQLSNIRLYMLGVVSSRRQTYQLVGSGQESYAS